jgi:FHS family L-fucose permease-like MFS transporter
MKSFLDLFRGPAGKNFVVTFTLVSTLFFLWGFCNGMIDVLNKHFQNSLRISKFESGFVQFANYIGYFCMAIPSGLLARRFGYKGGILIGLVLIAAGALWFIPATGLGTFAAFLAGLFILAAGLAVLETIANPYTTVLGPAEMGATRINLAQSCNALGTFFGPWVAGAFILSSTGEANRSNSTLYIPYLFIAALVVVLIVLFYFADLPDLQEQQETTTEAEAPTATPPLLGRWHFTLAVGAQFFYVAAQVGVWAYFINYMRSPDMPDVPDWLSNLLPAGWTFADAAGLHHVTDLGASRAFGGGILCFLAGRICGSVILRFCSAHLTLAVFGLINTILMAVIIVHQGWLSVAALFLSNFFMSIMYPTIFALGIRGLGAETKLGSSLIVMAIVGGAIMPLLMGWLADAFSMRAAFAMPLACFAYVMLYAAYWPKLEKLEIGHAFRDEQPVG